MIYFFYLLTGLALILFQTLVVGFFAGRVDLRLIGSTGGLPVAFS